MDYSFKHFKPFFAAVFMIFAAFMIFICCGFKFKRQTKPVIILSSNQITNSSLNITENNFYSGSRIYYLLYAPDGFREQGARLQISKQDDKVSNWGFSIISARDIYLNAGSKTYYDYIYLRRPGHYIIQFFYLDNKDYPFAHREFRVI